MDDKLIGVVIPTLGDRPEYLEESILSIRQAGAAHISVVRPQRASAIDHVLTGKVDSIVDDPGRGLAHAMSANKSSVLNLAWRRRSVGSRVASKGFYVLGDEFRCGVCFWSMSIH